ncbi:protein of unknown function [Paraburkholderia kururiensis]
MIRSMQARGVGLIAFILLTAFACLRRRPLAARRHSSAGLLALLYGARHVGARPVPED